MVQSFFSEKIETTELIPTFSNSSWPNGYLKNIQTHETSWCLFSPTWCPARPLACAHAKWGNLCHVLPSFWERWERPNRNVVLFWNNGKIFHLLCFLFVDSDDFVLVWVHVYLPEWDSRNSTCQWDVSPREGGLSKSRVSTQGYFELEGWIQNDKNSCYLDKKLCIHVQLHAVSVNVLFISIHMSKCWHFTNVTEGHLG